MGGVSAGEINEERMLGEGVYLFRVFKVTVDPSNSRETGRSFDEICRG